MGKKQTPEQILHIGIHCAATQNGSAHTASDIDGWHVKRGFRRNMSLAPDHAPHLRYIGYHYVLRSNGITEVGRPEHERGAHAKGYNKGSIGICLIGTNKFSVAQWFALKRLVEVLSQRYPHAQIVGHRDLSPDLNGDGVITPNEWTKTCPGFDVVSWHQRGFNPDKRHIYTPKVAA